MFITNGLIHKFTTCIWYWVGESLANSPDAGIGSECAEAAGGKAQGDPGGIVGVNGVYTAGEGIKFGDRGEP